MIMESTGQPTTARTKPATATHRNHTWHVDQPIAVGLVYRTRTGEQAYRVTRILDGDAEYATCWIERLNGVYAGNQDVHTLRYPAS
jgi:hypothetical protein